MSEYEFDVKRGNKGWSVTLPHQCDRWEITGIAYAEVPHDQAVAQLEQFIAEAQEALEHLKAERQVEHKYDWETGTRSKVIS